MPDTTPSWFAAPHFTPETLAQLRTLVSSAAYVAGSQGAFLVLEDDRHFDVPVQHGDVGEHFSASDEWIREFLAAPPNRDGIISLPDRNRIPGRAHNLRFLAGIPVCQAGQRIGILSVCDIHQRTISAAQCYVLLTLGAEIGDQLELQSLRLQRDRTQAAYSSLDLRLHLLETVVVHVNDSVLVTEAAPLDFPGPKVLYANAAFTRDTGYSNTEILGKSPRILQGPLTDRATLHSLRESLDARKPIQVEVLNYRKDGSLFWVELSIVPVVNQTGWFTHWVSVQRDITERKWLEGDTTIPTQEQA